MARTRRTITACSTSARSTSSYVSLVGRCGTGWRVSLRRATSGNTSVIIDRCGCRSSTSLPSARLELQRFSAMERAAGAQVLSLRLLPGQLLDQGTRRARSGARRGDPTSDGVAADRCHLPIPHATSHHQQSLDLHRSSPRARRASGSAHHGLGRDVSSRRHAGTSPHGENRGPGRHGVPLVKSERTVFESTALAPPDEPPDWLAGYFAIGAAIGAGIVGLAGRARESRKARAGFLALGWSLVAAGGTGRTRPGGALGCDRSRHGGVQ